jgi:hypothetical protein
MIQVWVWLALQNSKPGTGHADRFGIVEYDHAGAIARDFVLNLCCCTLCRR